MSQADLQTTLFDADYARECRREGFKAALPNMNTQNGRVYRLLRARGAMTAKEIAKELGMHVTSVHRVMGKLGKKKGLGLVVEDGKVDGGEGSPNTLYRVKQPQVWTEG